MESDSDWASSLRARALEARKKCGMVLDEERILKLVPLDYPSDDRLIRLYSDLLRVRQGAPRLFSVQAIALHTLSLASPRRGGVLPIPCGEGKTLISLLAGTVMGARKVLILLPASLKSQNLHDQKTWKSDYRVHPDIEVCSYERLSAPQGATYLEELGADLIIMDEAHCLADESSTRTRRLFDYFKAHPDTRAIVMSGTLTSRSLNDYAHLCQLALREGSPIPISYAVRERWSAVIDPGTEFTELDWQQFRWMVTGNPIPEERKKVAQLSFQKRFRSTPGVVVSTGEDKISSSLVYHRWHVGTDVAIDRALRVLSEQWILPNGDQLVDILEYDRARKQLHLGFYYVREWPDGERDEEWLGARRMWQASIRHILAQSRPGLDSPFWVESAAESGKLSPRILRFWADWVAVRERTPPKTVTHWISDERLRSMAEWTKAQKEPFILWYQNRAVGLRLQELGISLYEPGGPPPNTPETCALSIASFSEGIDGLQRLFADQMILQPPSSGRRWEQMVARTHRIGQTAHTVNVYFPAFFFGALLRGRREAGYIERTTGTRQKLIYGSRNDVYPHQEKQP